MKMYSRFALISILVAIPAIRAQPTSAPSTSPSTRPRHEVIIPPNFIKVEVSERTALCEPPDKEWIAKALDDLQPSARPTTMPSDLADMLAARRAELVKQMATDLSIADSSSIDTLLNEHVIPDLQKMADIRPPMFYLVCSKAKLKELVKGGWSDPRFRYNRVADDVAEYRSVSLSIQTAMDDLLIPALYDPTQPVEKRREALQKQVDMNEANIAASLATQGLILVQTGLVAAIDDAAIKPLGLKPGQEWFGIGVEGLLSTRYMTQLNGMRNEDLLRLLTDDDPRNPIRAATINLIHPTDPSNLRPNYAPAYIDALRRRSVLVVNSLIQRTGPEAIPKLLNAIKQSQPKDADALVEVIKQTVGVDLSRDVLPQS